MKVQYLLSSQQMHAISSLAHIDGILLPEIVSDKRLVEYDINEDQNFMLDSLLNTKGFIVKDEKQLPSEGDKYYFINSTGGIYSEDWNNDLVDKARIDIGNVFKTKKEAEFAYEKLRVLNQLRNLADDDQEWNSIYQHYYIIYDLDHDKLDIWSNYYVMLSPGYWFKSKASAEAAIKTIGEDKLKKYVFNVKE